MKLATQPRAPANLPLDIMDEITSFLNDDRDTLSKLSLASKSMVSPCQRLLFRSVKIHFRLYRGTQPGSKEPIWHYCWAPLPFKDHPNLSHYVRDLSIMHSRHWDRTSKQYADAEDLGQILLAFPYIRNFTLSRFDFETGSKDKAEIERAIVNILVLPSLEAIKFSDLSSFPITRLYALNNLKSLDLHRCTFSSVLAQDNKSPLGSSTRRKTHLRRLCVKLCADADVQMVSALLDGSLCGAERLEFPVSGLMSIFPQDGSNLQLLWKILYANCENIKQLNITTSNPTSLTQANMIFSDLPSLKTLHLSFGHFNLDQMIQSATSFLLEAQGPSKLEEICLYVQMTLREANSRYYGSQERWDQLENCLLQSKFGSIQRFRMVFRVDVPQGCWGPWMRIWRTETTEEVKNLFPILRDMICCKVDTE